MQTIQHNSRFDLKCKQILTSLDNPERLTKCYRKFHIDICIFPLYFNFKADNYQKHLIHEQIVWLN